MNSENIKKACGFVKKSSNPLILIPENFDIDAISGALGFYFFLKKNNKNPRIACSVEIPENFLFLSEKKIIESGIDGERRYKISFATGESRIKELSYIQEGKVLEITLAAAGEDFALEKPRVECVKPNYDLAIVAGSPDLASLGKIYRDNRYLFSEIPIISVDHHSFNEYFGTVNLVRTDSCVSEIMSEISGMISRESFDSKIADLFLTGIIAATDNFQSAKISAGTFEAASILLRAGANREEIIKRLAGINLLAAEKIEFYPSDKITKRIIDRMSRESSWYLDQEKGKAKHFDGLKILTFNQRFFYLAAILGVIPALLILERANVALSPSVGGGENIYSQKNFIGNGEKIFLNDPLNFSANNREIFSLPSGIIQNPLQNEIAAKIGLPKKFSAPSFGINAEIQEVGLTPRGGMGSPGNYKSAAWFKPGVKPGENGNAVIAGHLDTNLGAGGIFQNLNKLKPGDYVYVIDEYNRKMRFRAVISKVYDAENPPMEEIFGLVNNARLNLITCDGAWDVGKKSYTKRLVVFTEYDPE